MRGFYSEGLIYGGKFAFQNWVSLIVGSKFTIFALFYFIFAGKFPSTSPWGAYIWRGDLTALGFFALLDWGGGLYLEALIFRILWYIVVYIKSLNAAWTTSYYFVIFFILSTPTPLRVMI